MNIRNGKWLNSSVFKQEALNFQKTGYYTNALVGTPDWIDYWTEQLKRCLEGYEVSGEKITGHHYFYLNFTQIQIVDNFKEGSSGIVAKKVQKSPDFWDGDYDYFWSLEIAKNGLFSEESQVRTTKKERESYYKYVNKLSECVLNSEEYYVIEKEKHLVCQTILDRIGLKVKPHLDYLEGGNHLIIGKEQPNSCIVKTPFGDKFIGDLLEGDLIHNSYGSMSKVLSVNPQGEKDVYEITFFDGRKTRCGLEHLWEIYGSIYKKEKRTKKVVSLKEILKTPLKVGVKYRSFIKISQAVQHLEVAVPIPPYTLGVILGDGNVTKQFKISGIDDEVFKNVLTELNLNYEDGEYAIGSVYSANKQLVFKCSNEVKNYYKKLYNVGVCASKVNPVYEELKKLKLNCKSKNKYIPNVYKTASIEQRIELVKGLMDTDGCITKDSSISFGNTSETLVNDLQEILYSLGIQATKRTRKDGIFILYINSNIDIFGISRKKERIIVSKKNRKFVAITEIKKLDYKEASTCILVDSLDHTYLTDGYIVTHNSRRKGYSFKNGAICANIYNTERNAQVVIGAFEKKFLYPKGTMSMSSDYLNFLNEFTGWAKSRDEVDKIDHKKASYKTSESGVVVYKGYKSEIFALTFNGNADAARGKSPVIVLFEEAGVFPNLKDSYNATLPGLTAGSKITGQILVFGCVCAGTKVYNADGKLCNIEDIDTSIIGYAGKGVIKENVSYLAAPNKKVCYRITCTNGSIIECSDDHPLLYSNRHLYKDKKKVVAFKRAMDLQVGEQLMQIRQVPVFGELVMKYPRLVGLLIGDGYYGLKATPQLAIADKGIEQYLIDNNINYSVYKRYDNYLAVGITGYIEDLKDLGIYGQTKKAKRLPFEYWKYNIYSLSELLGGYFDADGSISYNVKKNSYKIALTSIVKELLEEVKDVLFRFGISCNIFKRNDKVCDIISKINNKTYTQVKSNVRYSLEISSIEDIIEFKKHIHFTDTKKNSILQSVDINRVGRNTYNDCVFEEQIKGKGLIFNHTRLDNLKSVYIKKIECIGEKDVYNLTADTTHTYITNRFISANTGGDMESGTVDYADMFYNPISYGMMPFINIWDENGENTVCGFFHSVILNMEGFYDIQGNSDIDKAKEYELNRRKKILENSSSNMVLQKHVQEFPFSPSEAFLTVSTNNFPILEIRNQLNKVIVEKLQLKKGVCVFLERKEGKVVARPDLKNILTPVINYNPKLPDLTGCPIIYEYPVTNAPKGLYKIGYDPYRQDLSKGVSLAAIYVYKGVYKDSYTNNIIVAEYVGRPQEADDVNKIASQLGELYNAEIMHENEVTHVKNYFRRIKRLDQLAVQPNTVISKNIKNSTVARVYGIHMVEQLKDAGEKYIKDWLLQIKDYDENNIPILNLETIYSIGLLEELLKYSRKGNVNTDRIMSFMMCMFQVQEEELGKKYESKENNSLDHILSALNKLYKK